MQTSKIAALSAILLVTARAYAQPAATEPPPVPAGSPAASTEPQTTTTTAQPATPSGAPASAPASGANKPGQAKITVGGYLEAYYQAHFQDPSNRITNLRGYDNRSRSFTLSNAAIDVKGEKGPVAARIIRLEYRHDQAQSDAFFGGTVAGDGVATPYVFDRKSQDTATLGVTAWF